MKKVSQKLAIGATILIGTVATIWICIIFFQFKSINAPVADLTSTGNLILSIIGTCTVIVASIYAVQQLRESTNSRKVSAYIAITEFLQNEEIRKCREMVYKLGDGEKNLHYSKWTNEDKKAVQKVFYSFDLVGNMIEHGMLESELTKNWDYAINKTRDITSEYLEEIRKTRGGTKYFPGLETVFKLSKNRLRAEK